MKASIGIGLCVFGISLPAAAQNDSDMSAGGLAPPPAIESESDQEAKRQATERELERAEEEDSGRGLEFVWLNGEIGVEHLGLSTFNSNDLVDADVVDTTQTGLTYGGGLGFRLVFLTLGARFRLADMPDYQLWTLNGEVGLRIPLGSVEPYFTFGGGYASLGSFDASNIGSDLNRAGVDVTGFDVRAGFGLDVYLSHVFSLGGNLTGEALFLSRPELDASDISSSASGEQVSAAVYAGDGTSVGGGVTLTLVAGLHF